MENKSVVAYPRVTSGAIKPFTYRAHCTPCEGEAIETKAVGVYVENGERWPVSIHFTLPPGSETVPPTGDHLKVTIERCTVEEEQQASQADRDAILWNR